ncbi:MAG TPA: DUF899 family protein [Candidatus Dormibacteraeota bacterium]|nr:DUF899 family protein [Candidatus Dormibacteraeota bacterium]
MSLHKEKWPGETLEYRRARNALLREEIKLRRSIESVAAKRRSLPLGGAVPTDYVFDSWRPGDDAFPQVRMSELFEPGKRTLVLYNFMFPESPDSHTPCPSCTSIIDAIDGAAHHLMQRVGFAVIAKAPIADFRRHARSRGWQHARLLSSAGNTFNRDYHAEGENGQQMPLAHVFVRRGKRMRHFWSSELWFTPSESGQDLRHVDFMWPLWSILDLTPEGRGKGFYPQLEYT